MAILLFAEGSKDVRAPQTVTCRVGTGDSPAPLSSLLPAAIHEVESDEKAVVLAGLHACGDLSATMLRLVALIPQQPSHS